MADKTRYPQIPSTVWWGVRSILQRTPNATLNERLLGVQLNVQEAAARAYINELRAVGIINEDGKATLLAQKWRLDDTYAEAVEQLIQDTYPEGLIDIAPPGEAERQKVVSWFQREGLGQGAAGNKAATYLLLSSPTPNEAPRAGQNPPSAEAPPRVRPARQSSSPVRTKDDSRKTPARSNGGQRSAGAEGFPLNINIQIHISADAGTEQIESIFQAMRRYLYDAPDS